MNGFEREIMSMCPPSHDTCAGDSEQEPPVHSISISRDRQQVLGTGGDATTTTSSAAECINLSAVATESAATLATVADIEILQLLASRRSRHHPFLDHRGSSLPQSCFPYGSDNLTGLMGGGLTLTNSLPRRDSSHPITHNKSTSSAATTTVMPGAAQNHHRIKDFMYQQQVPSQYYHGNPFCNTDLLLGQNQCYFNDYRNQYRSDTNTNSDDHLMNLINKSWYGGGHSYYPPSELASIVSAHNDRYLLSIRDILNHAPSSIPLAASHSNRFYNLSSQAFSGRRCFEESGNCATTAHPSPLQCSNEISSSTLGTSTMCPPSISLTTSSNNICAYPQDFARSSRHPTSLVVKSDSAFLDPVHIFLRRSCIELFSTTRESMMSQARGARASKVGQVGLRCIWCKNEHSTKLTTQAICFPSKRETIFDSVRNYQRKHIDACPCIPEQVKTVYKSLLMANVPYNKSQRLLKAYYAEAASELGIVDSPKGLIFGAPPNTSDTPSENLQAILRAAESPDTSAEFWKNYKALSAKDKSVSLRKFDHLVSEGSREVIMKAKKDTSSALVCAQDFPKVGDVEFLLYKHVIPFKPSLAFLERRHINPEEFGDLTGLCCKFCAHVNKGGANYSGVYLPTSFSAFADYSFTQSLLSHMMACRNVPRELKDTFDELKHLASEHCVVAKRGSIKKFLEKIWERLQTYQND